MRHVTVLLGFFSLLTAHLMMNSSAARVLVSVWRMTLTKKGFRTSGMNPDFATQSASRLV